jgi:hypothetical protein
MALSNEVLDFLTDLAWIEVPPVWMPNRLDLHVVG